MILIVILIFLLIILNIPKKEHFSNQNEIKGMYFINLDRNPERRVYMKNNLKIIILTLLDTPLLIKILLTRNIYRTW